MPEHLENHVHGLVAAHADQGASLAQFVHELAIPLDAEHEDLRARLHTQLFNTAARTDEAPVALGTLRTPRALHCARAWLQPIRAHQPAPCVLSCVSLSSVFRLLSSVLIHLFLRRA